MEMKTEGNIIRLTLGKDDIYKGHNQSEDGLFGIHVILVNGVAPMKVYKHFTQIMEVFDHEGWEIEQKTPGDGSLIRVPPIEVWSVRHRDGMNLREARFPEPYNP